MQIKLLVMVRSHIGIEVVVNEKSQVPYDIFVLLLVCWGNLKLKIGIKSLELSWKAYILAYPIKELWNWKFLVGK